MSKPFKIQGRTKSTVLENIPVIARDGEAPEAYVPGDVGFVLRAMNAHSALLDALKGLREPATNHDCFPEPCSQCAALDAADKAIALAESRKPFR